MAVSGSVMLLKDRFLPEQGKRKGHGRERAVARNDMRIVYPAGDALREGIATLPPCAVRVQSMGFLLSNIGCVSFRKICFISEAAEVYHGRVDASRDSSDFNVRPFLLYPLRATFLVIKCY